ncbi:MAG: tetratricopeptide repeat protein [Mariprofundus sp.]
MNQLIAALLLLTLSACAAHKTVETDTAKPDHTQQAAPTAENLSGMQPGFLYLAAQNAMREGNRELALSLLTALVAKDPHAIAPRMELTDLLMQSGRIDEAEKQIAELLTDKAIAGKQHQQIQLAQYRIIIARKQPELALEKLAAFLQQHPTNNTARAMQASILAGQGKIDASLSSIHNGIKRKDSASLRLLQAQVLIKKGDLPAAKESLRRMQKLAPDSDTAVLMLGAMANQSNDKEGAEALLRAFLADHPGSIRVSHSLAKLLIKQDRLAEAILIYRDAAQQAGDSPQTLSPLGMLYFQHKDYTQAAETFRKLLKIQANDSSRFYLAASLEATDKQTEAITLYQQISPDSALGTQAQIRLATMEAQADNVAGAETRLTTLLKAQPQQLDAHLLLSNIRLNQLQYRRLLNDTEPLLRIKKLPPQLLFNRAVAFEHFKEYNHVESTINRILKHSPNYPEALNFLGYTYADQDIKLDRAEALVLRALQLKPDDGYYLDSLAWVYYKKGAYERAQKTQLKAIKQVSDDSVMHEHYGDILWRQGNTQGAQKAWRKALELKSAYPKLIKQKIAQGLPALKK